MTIIHRIDPPFHLYTPKGDAVAHFLIDRGVESDLEWVCAMDETGECWTFKNWDVRFAKNVTLGRPNVERPVQKSADGTPLVACGMCLRTWPLTAKITKEMCNSDDCYMRSR